MYKLMKKKDQEKYAKLISLEINSYLDKIYSTMRRRAKLKPASISPENIKFRNASVGATKMWEFKLNPREDAAKGNIGSIIIATAGIDKSLVRKQRALLIAAELYVYHAFANHKNPHYFNMIKNQNQYIDMLKKLAGRNNAHEIRDQAIRYVIEEIKEHALAHLSTHGWTVSMTRLKRHYPDIAGILGSSEKTFKEAFRKQGQRFTSGMLKQQEDMVRKEIEDINHLISMIKQHEKKIRLAYTKKLINIHIANLKTFRSMLERIRKNLDKWVLVDKKAHKTLRNRKHIPQKELIMLLEEEAKAEKVDMNKVYLVFRHFEKEKINILNDLEMVDKINAEAQKKRR